jgi:hypothetical protein
MPENLMFASLLALLLVGIAVVVIASLIFALLGALFSMVLGLLGFLLFKVAPVVLVCWLVVRWMERRRPAPAMDSGDAAWLDR